jgi:hypothetical protein
MSKNASLARWDLAIVVVLVGLAALSRVVPHPGNATPVTAVALFGGAMLASPLGAAVLTVAALAGGDLALGLFPYPGMAWVYGALLAVTFLGRGLLRQRQDAGRVLGTAVGGGLLFFVVTNFGVWAAGSLYPRTLAGLASCFVAGVPFYRNQLLGDVLYTGLLFGAHHLAHRAVRAQLAA